MTTDQTTPVEPIDPATDTAPWENIPYRVPGYREVVRARITHVLENDPFVRMFSPEIRATMVECFLGILVYDRPSGSGITNFSCHQDINMYTSRAARVMPLGFVTDEFKTHISNLIAFALIPTPEYDNFHRPV